MRKELKIFVLIFISAFTCKAQNISQTINITGEVNTEKKILITITSVTDEQIKKEQVIYTNNFNTNLKYSIGKIININVFSEEIKKNINLFVEPGDSLHLKIYKDSVLFSGDNIKENRQLDSWAKLKDSFFKDKANYNDIDNELKEFDKEIRIRTLKDKSEFSILYNTTLKVDFLSLKLSFLRKIKDEITKNKLKENINSTINKDFPNNISIQLPSGCRLIERYLSLVEGVNYHTASIDVIASKIKNNDLSSTVIYNKLLTIREGNPDFVKILRSGLTYLKSKKHKQLIRRKIDYYLKTQKGEPAIDFCGFTKDGKLVKLKDLIGKPIYVDVWATWCAPCRRELPYLDTLIKEYSERINFLKVSIDSPRNRDKWEKMVSKNNNANIVNIIVDKEWESDLLQKYNIKGIPRFMFFDKKGNIISTNCMRPSDNRIKKLFDKILQE